MTITTRAAKGSPLTNAELDTNFTELRDKEYLTALAQSVHAGAVVDVCLYDTSRDSDGGAWRKRCQHTSWYNEALVAGKWITGGPYTLALAQAAGGIVGDYFQGNDGKFYQITGPAAIIEVFRGNTREFPALTLIVAESGRIIIYDATQPGCPMWMVFVRGASSRGWVGSTCIYALNGVLFTGSNKAGTDGEIQGIEFCADRIWQRVSSSNLSGYLTPVQIASRGIAASVTPGLGTIVSSIVNDIAAIILPDAPVDPATGLPVPTIAVATNGGVSIIKHDGTVANSSSTSAFTRVAIGPDCTLYAGMGAAAVSMRYAYNIGSIGASWALSSLINTSVPPIWATATGETATVAMRRAMVAHGKSNGFGYWCDNPANNLKGMVAYITNFYNSGWMVGDIRGAWLADTVSEVINASGELVTNGTFDVDTTGWTASGGGTATVSAGVLTLTNAAAGGAAQSLNQAITTVPGRAYSLVADVTGAATFLLAGTAAVGAQNGSAYGTTGGKLSLTFIATAAMTYVTIGINSTAASQAGTFDNVTCKLAEPDRSAKARGLAVNGSITKSPVAAGAQLVGYSGFSAANYLEQPYSSDLDFGTGDCQLYCGWAVLSTIAGVNNCLMHRSLAGQGGGIMIAVDAAGAILVYGSNNTGYTLLLTSSACVLKDTPCLIDVSRSGGTLRVRANGGVSVGSVAHTADLTYANTTTRVGVRQDGANPVQGKLALIRAGATPPSDDQLAQIYRDELPLFQPNAQCTIDGTSSTVTALAYDDTPDLLHVGTSWGRSAFHGLRRIESSATQVGAITALAAGQGAHIAGGATAARYVQPAMLLRDELRRQAEAKRAQGAIPIPQWFTADGVKVDFVLPQGLSGYAVYRQGLLMREGAANDYTTSFDGYKYTVTFTSAPLINHNICIMGVR